MRANPLSTANKQLIARSGPKLIALARENEAAYRVRRVSSRRSASDFGLQEGLAGDELFKVCGILNGTCNFILSKN